MNDHALSIVPRSIPEVQTLADLITKSVLLPEALRGKTADIIVSILAGAELGLAPMASIRGVHIISGKPVLAADTMMGLCLGSGLAEYFSQIETTDTSITFETKRKGAPTPQRCTWTIEMAKRAGIYKNTWLAYPRQMLAARCKAELARLVFPDLLAGVYDPDEIGHMAPVTTAAPVVSIVREPDAIDAEIVESVDHEPVLATIEQAETIEALKAVSKTIAALKLTGPAKDAANDRYKARLAVLRDQAPKAEATA